MDRLSKIMDKAFEAFDLEKWNEAEELYRQALKQANEEQSNSIFYMLAFTLAMKGQYDDAFSMYNRLLKEARQKEEEAIMLHQIGMVYRMAKQYDEAIGIFNQEKMLRKKHLPANNIGFSAIAYELGFIALEKQEFEIARKSFEKALEYGDDAQDMTCIGCAERGLGQYYKAVNCSKEAMMHYKNSIAAFRKAGDDKAAAEVHQLLKSC